MAQAATVITIINAKAGIMLISPYKPNAENMLKYRTAIPPPSSPWPTKLYFLPISLKPIPSITSPVTMLIDTRPVSLIQFLLIEYFRKNPTPITIITIAARTSHVLATAYSAEIPSFL